MARKYLKKLRRNQKRVRARAASRAKQLRQDQVSAVERMKMPTLYQMLQPCFSGDPFITDPLIRGMAQGAAERMAHL